MPTTRKPPRHAYDIPNRHGKPRLYFWRGKGHRKIRLREAFNTPAFYKRYAELLAGDEPPETNNGGFKKKSSPGKAAKPLTWRWLCQEYFTSLEYRGLAGSTCRVRRQILEGTWQEPIEPGSAYVFADFPLEKFRTKAIRILRDRKIQFQEGAESPSRTNTEAANSRVKAIRAVLRWALASEIYDLEQNWARQVPLFSSLHGGFQTWSLADIALLEAKFPVGSTPRLALALLLYTGQRRGDVVRLGQQMLDSDGKLHFTQEKNRRSKPVNVTIPIVPELRAIIEATPCGELVYLISKHGRPFVKESFGNWFHDRCIEAGLRNRSAHGLRKACVVKLISIGCTPHEVMAITGHRTLKEIDRYAREYAREQASEQMLDKWLAANAA